MNKPLSLLVVDVSEDWEETLKAHERGHFIDWSIFYPGKYERGKLQPADVPLSIKYPHGTVRAGFNAIIDTTRLAQFYGITRYAVHLYTGWSDGEEQTCHSLQPYIAAGDQYEKHGLSAFGCPLAGRLEADKCEHLLVIGYDRDACVLATIKDAVERGIKVVTSEHCMLTADCPGLREKSLAYIRENTVFLESLVDVWNYLREAEINAAE